jgi:hypothetical protein
MGQETSSLAGGCKPEKGRRHFWRDKAAPMMEDFHIYVAVD